METFGDRLKSERQDRGLSIQDVAGILHVDHDRLRALERNDFEALPGEAEMMDCLHAYAECLQVDADLMIEDYVQERDRCLRGLEDIEAERLAETTSAAISTGAERLAETASTAISAEAERRPRFSPGLVALVVAAVAMLAAWWMLSPNGTAPTPEKPVASAPVEPRPPAPKPPADAAPTPVELPAAIAPTAEEPPADVGQTPAEPPAAIAPTAVQPPVTRSAPVTPASSLLSIAEHGVGTAVENRSLVGRSDRFTEGTRVWFWTRVEGGDRGDRIDHVWLREGEEAARISLEIGGSSWRTHSANTLQAGATGDWAVEARDDAGRVLARSEFVCMP